MINLSNKDINEFNMLQDDFVIVRRLFKDYKNNRCHYMWYHSKIGIPTYDYIRLRTAGLCAEEVKNRNIKGSIAEVGVFKGSFASALNALFPDRNLYLYDTFEGFSENDIESEINPEKTRQQNWYKDINSASKGVNLIDDIIEILPYPDKAIFRKGFFPETAMSDINEVFAFVSIDVDLYKPTLEALKFFYPRLSIGGYIFVHDGKFSGVNKALQEFISDSPPPLNCSSL